MYLSSKIFMPTLGTVASRDVGTSANNVVALDGSQNATFPATVTAANYDTSSDERLKNIIRRLDQSDADGILEFASAVEYTLKANPDKTQYGFIAQEFEKFAPEFVTDGADGMKALNYTMLIPVLVLAVKSLKDEVENLREQLRNK